MNQQNRTSINSTLSRRLITINISIIAGLCALFFSLFSFYYSSQQEELILKNIETTLDSKELMFEQILQITESSGTQLRLNNKIVGIFDDLYYAQDGVNYFKQEPQLFVDIYNEMIPYLIKSNGIKRICIYNKDSDFIGVGSYIDYNKAKEYRSEEEFLEIDEHLKEHTSYFEFYDYDPLMPTNEDAAYISLVQELKQPTYLTGNKLGYIEVQIDIEELKKNMGTVIDEQYVTFFCEEKSFLEIGSSSMIMKDTTYERNIEDTPFVIQLNRKGGFEATHVTILIIFLLMIALVVLLYYAQTRLIRNITAPLITLCQNIELEDIAGIKGTEGEVDEIKQLNEAMTIMLERIKESVDQIVIEKTDKMNAQMLALQAQINPHFIHNTLAVVTSLIGMEEGDKAIDAIEKLSSMIRHSADYSKNQSYLAEELESIRNYLELIQIKYEDNFSYDIKIEDDISKVEVLKYILQPLVENSIHHSLNYAEYPWYIGVRCSCSNQIWKVEIFDNGVGIDEENVEKIKARYEAIKTTNVEDLLKQLKIGGYSMMNIIVRMHLLYKDSMIFDIKRNEKGGTTVIIGGVTND